MVYYMVQLWRMDYIVILSILNISPTKKIQKKKKDLILLEGRKESKYICMLRRG